MHINLTALIYLVTRATNRFPAGSDTGYPNTALEPLRSVLDSSFLKRPRDRHCKPLCLCMNMKISPEFLYTEHGNMYPSLHPLLIVTGVDAGLTQHTARAKII